MGFVHRAFVAAGVGFAVSAIVGCGSSGGSLLSQSQANTLSGQLNQVQLALDEGECVRAQRYLSDFQNRLSQLGGVSSTLLSNLDQGASTIASLTSTQCAGQTVTTQKTHTTRTRTSTTTTATETRTVPTFTVTTTTPTTYSTPTYTEPTTSTTSTTGGVGPTGDTTTTTSSTTITTPGSGGTGLGGTGTLTTSTGTDTTTTSGSGF
jgi:hypothetical protein